MFVLGGVIYQFVLARDYRYYFYTILGEGERFFNDGLHRVDLRLVGATTTRKGVTLLMYASVSAPELA
jgi:hypothetical protein